MWKPIVEKEGYEVSDKGEIRSIDRVIKHVRNGVEFDRKLKGKTRKLCETSNGYLFVVFEYKGKSYLVHRLVANAFIPNPNNLPQVNHKDGNKKNNNVENLEWVTCSENHRHSYSKLNRKEHKLTKNVVIKADDGTEHRFVGCNAAAKFLGVVAGSIGSAAIKGHKCKGYKVFYETR